MTPALTLNCGLRWEVVRPFQPTTPTYSIGDAGRSLRRVRASDPAPKAGSATSSSRATSPAQACRRSTRATTTTTRAFKTEWGNFAPNVGVAWRPNVQSGWLRAVLGDPGAGDAPRAATR